MFLLTKHQITDSIKGLNFLFAPLLPTFSLIMSNANSAASLSPTDDASAGVVQIVFTDNAARKVKALMDEENNSSLMLRVFISGGGCSGFQYGFTFDEERGDDDFSLEKLGVTVLVDSMSYQYLSGAEIDYREGLEGSQFVIRNPNVTSTCGCGSSFAV